MLRLCSKPQAFTADDFDPLISEHMQRAWEWKKCRIKQKALVDAINEYNLRPL